MSQFENPTYLKTPDIPEGVFDAIECFGLTLAKPAMPDLLEIGRGSEPRYGGRSIQAAWHANGGMLTPCDLGKAEWCVLEIHEAIAGEDRREVHTLPAWKERKESLRRIRDLCKKLREVIPSVSEADIERMEWLQFIDREGSALDIRKVFLIKDELEAVAKYSHAAMTADRGDLEKRVQIKSLILIFGRYFPPDAPERDAKKLSLENRSYKSENRGRPKDAMRESCLKFVTEVLIAYGIETEEGRDRFINEWFIPAYQAFSPTAK